MIGWVMQEVGEGCTNTLDVRYDSGTWGMLVPRSFRKIIATVHLDLFQGTGAGIYLQAVYEIGPLKCLWQKNFVL
jgi:hypothetical protein